MKSKTQEASRILDAVHETAQDLQAAGFISKRRMKNYDALCADKATPDKMSGRN
jgi:putative transcriptional regulator